MYIWSITIFLTKQIQGNERYELNLKLFICIIIKFYFLVFIRNLPKHADLQQHVFSVE